MAGLFAALTHPVFRWLTRRFGGNRYLAATVNLLLLILVVLLPVGLLAGIFIAQAVDVGKSLTPIAVQFVKNPETFVTWLHDLPYYQELMAYEEELKNKIADSIEAAGGFLVGGLSQVALGTANLLFMSLVFLYTFFFFQLDGHKTIHAILYYLPLEDRVERRLLTKFTLVTQAMIKGTLLIGILQGALAGIAFAVAGVPHSVFWGTVMAVLSIVPGIGSAVVWVPASIILIVQGNIIAGIGLHPLLRPDRRQHRQRAAPHPGGQRHQHARADDLLRHHGRAVHLRHGRAADRPRHRLALPDHLGDLRRGVPRRVAGGGGRHGGLARQSPVEACQCGRSRSAPDKRARERASGGAGRAGELLRRHRCPGPDRHTTGLRACPAQAVLPRSGGCRPDFPRVFLKLRRLYY
jgi:hypothetical protein